MSITHWHFINIPSPNNALIYVHAVVINIVIIHCISSQNNAKERGLMGQYKERGLMG